MKKVSILLPLLIILALLQGCHGSSSVANTSSVRLVNGDLNALNMYYWPGGSTTSPAASGISYSVASSGVSIGSGDVTIAVANAVSSVPSTGQQFSFSGGYNYTMVAFPTYSNGQENLQVAQLVDNQVIPPSGSGLFGIADYSSADKLDVYVALGNNASLQGARPWTLQGGISGNTAYAQEPTGSTSATFHVQVTGAGAGPNNDVRLDIPSITIGNQQVMTLALLPTQGGVLLDGMLILQQGINPMANQPYVTGYKNGSVRVRVATSVLNATSNTQISVSANSNAITLPSPVNNINPSYTVVPITGLTASYPQSGSQPVASASLSIAVGNSDASCTNLTASPGQDLTLLITGDVNATLQCNLIVDDNTLAPDGDANLRIINGDNSYASGITLTSDNVSILYKNNTVYSATFGAATPAVNVSLTPLPFSQGSPLTVSPLGIDLGAPPLTQHSVYSVFVLGPASAVLSTDRTQQ